MKAEPTYPAARAIAPVVVSHFSTCLHSSVVDRTGLAPVPTIEAVETMVNAAFWTSLRKEEGYSPKTSLVYLPPEKCPVPMQFESPLPLNPKILTKLAPAVERPGIQLGVWHNGEEMYVWGAARELPKLCLVVEIVEPGMLVIKHKRLDEFGKYYNIAILKGDEIKIVDESRAGVPDSPGILRSILNFTGTGGKNPGIDVLVQMAVSMRAHRRGGMLLVVPSETWEWRESIIHPIPYAMNPPFSRLSALVRREIEGIDDNLWEGALRLAIEGVAGLTAADGATIMNDRYELLAFGAKVGRSDKSTRVERMILTEPVEDNIPQVLHPGQNGGTRHLAAAQFVHDQHDAIALVASQDGRFTLFSWSAGENMVHAHRVDSLLL